MSHFDPSMLSQTESANIIGMELISIGLDGIRALSAHISIPWVLDFIYIAIWTEMSMLNVFQYDSR